MAQCKKDLVLLLLCSCVIKASAGCDVSFKIKSGRNLQVTSPDYPEDSPRRMHCFYDLKAHFNSGDVIHLRVLDVTLSCDDEENSLEVFDAFSTNPRYLGRICKGSTLTFVSPKDRLYLVYQTGKRATAWATASSGSSVAVQSESGADLEPGSGRAFRLEVRAVPEFTQCYNYRAKVMKAESEVQQFVSPYFPFEVAPNVHCRWLIKAPSNRAVTLEIVETSMRGSNDCENFGLYIYDGKTTYDDTNIGVICDNQSDSGVLHRYRSSENFLLVVFSSSSHVLHSGGGVKLQYYSVLLDTPSEQKDTKLLYSLVGIFAAVACFTALVVILRFVVIPARLKKASRTLDLSAAACSRSRSETGDPPPPYSPSVATIIPHNHGVPGSGEFSTPHSPTPASSASLLSCFRGRSFFPWRPRVRSSTGDASFTRSRPLSGLISPGVIISQGPTVASASAVENDYQELPFLSLALGRANRNVPDSPGVIGGGDADSFVSVDITSDSSSDRETAVGEETLDGHRSRRTGSTGSGPGDIESTPSIGKSTDDYEMERTGTQEGLSFSRRHLCVPASTEARFSTDSGFREGEHEEEIDNNDDVEEEEEEEKVGEELEEPVYHQVESPTTLGIPSTNNPRKHLRSDRVTAAPESVYSESEDSEVVASQRLCQLTVSNRNTSEDNTCKAYSKTEHLAKELEVKGTQRKGEQEKLRNQRGETVKEQQLLNQAHQQQEKEQRDQQQRQQYQTQEQEHQHLENQHLKLQHEEEVSQQEQQQQCYYNEQNSYHKHQKAETNQYTDLNALTVQSTLEQNEQDYEIPLPVFRPTDANKKYTLPHRPSDDCRNNVKTPISHDPGLPEISYYDHLVPEVTNDDEAEYQALDFSGSES